MAYKVLNKFKEVNHDNHIYSAGDTYPAEGFKVDQDRVSFLSQKHRRYGVAFIAEEKKQEENKNLSAMSREELEKVKNDKLKAYLDENEIEYASNAVKDDLIKLVLREE